MVTNNLAHATMRIDIECEGETKYLYLYVEIHITVTYQVTVKTEWQKNESYAKAHYRAMGVANLKLKRIPGFIEDAKNV